MTQTNDKCQNQLTANGTNQQQMSQSIDGKWHKINNKCRNRLKANGTNQQQMSQSIDGEWHKPATNVKID